MDNHEEGRWQIGGKPIYYSLDGRDASRGGTYNDNIVLKQKAHPHERDQLFGSEIVARFIWPELHVAVLSLIRQFRVPFSG